MTQQRGPTHRPSCLPLCPNYWSGRRDSNPRPSPWQVDPPIPANWNYSHQCSSDGPASPLASTPCAQILRASGTYVARSTVQTPKSGLHSITTDRLHSAHSPCLERASLKTSKSSLGDPAGSRRRVLLRFKAVTRPFVGRDQDAMRPGIDSWHALVAVDAQRFAELALLPTCE